MVHRIMTRALRRSLIIFIFLDPSSGSYMTVHMKNCYPTPFHARGCLAVDEDSVSSSFLFKVIFLKL